MGEALKHLIVTNLVDWITLDGQTNVPTSDDRRLDLVGLRSVNLTGKERLSVIVRHMDPLEEERAKDTTRSGGGEMAAVFKDWPVGIIGGRYFEIVRGVIELRCDFTRSRETPARADSITQYVLARIRSIVRRHIRDLGSLVDEFGEECVAFRLVSGSEYDSGEGTSNVSRYFLRWAAVTLTPRD